MWFKIKSWIKKPENLAYIVLVMVCLIVAGDTYGVMSILLTLVFMALMGFLIRKVFFKD
jgi:hypothetical protein